MVFSKLYNLREQGFTNVLEIMKKDTSFSRAEMTKALCQVLRKGLSDKVLTVRFHIIASYTICHNSHLI